MGAYLLRRLLVAVPSLLGISLILFTILALFGAVWCLLVWSDLAILFSGVG